jgi:Mg2+/Co2+ transporter CorB
LSHFQLILFVISLILLVMISAFFSCAETGLMTLNRYRLRHNARLKKRFAILVLKLLKRPDQLLSVILIGNNCANILASAMATILAIHFLGEKGIIASTILLTIIVLIFAEVAPKTLAAVYPERIAKIVAWPLWLLIKIFYPIVWLINKISNGLLRLVNVKISAYNVEPLSRDELRSVVYETSGRMSNQYCNMLLGILDLNKVTVNDVMVPRHEIAGINLNNSWDIISQVLAKSPYDWMPVYHDDINQIVGMFHVRELMSAALAHQAITLEFLQNKISEPYFVPEHTPLNIQLLNFQQQHKRTALVVDEYGEIKGLLTLADILEEIVGEFTAGTMESNKIIQSHVDGSYTVDGSISLRELKRLTQWSLPVTGPRTISGLIIEYLEAIPRPGTGVKINDYPIEVLNVQDNRVKIAKIFPQLKNNQRDNIQH